MYSDACIGAFKRCSLLDAVLDRSERDITEGDKFYFRVNVGTVKKLGDNKGEKILF